MCEHTCTLPAAANSRWATTATRKRAEKRRHESELARDQFRADDPAECTSGHMRNEEIEAARRFCRLRTLQNLCVDRDSLGMVKCRSHLRDQVVTDFGNFA
ncbi:unnamed protein product [Heligmosomoides polygyrus]|uniref:Uncharacterized protein n=1 Tax=Heligmosomoides polygyrus TaxID=6339 RepID=A0A183GH10_HELPZ|nr:unnamed protein product [Heligmosomoides polygyrus]